MRLWSTYEKDGFVLRRRLLSPESVARLVAIGQRVHAQWLQEHAEEARKHDLINSTGLTASRYFQPPFDSERAPFSMRLPMARYGIFSRPCLVTVSIFTALRCFSILSTAAGGRTGIVIYNT